MAPLKLAAIAMVLSLGACAHSPIPIGLPCSVGPIYPSEGFQKRWTRSEKSQVLLVNETGEKLCGWKP